MFSFFILSVGGFLGFRQFNGALPEIPLEKFRQTAEHRSAQLARKCALLYDKRLTRKQFADREASTSKRFAHLPDSTRHARKNPIAPLVLLRVRAKFCPFTSTIWHSVKGLASSCR